MTQHNPTIPMDMDALRERIKATLAQKGLSYQNLSDLSGIPKSTLDSFLSGRSVPAFDRVYAVVAALGISLDPPADEAGEVEPQEQPDSYTYAAVQEIRAHYIHEIEEIKQAHAAENAARDRHLAAEQKSKRLWCIVSLVLIALIVTWLVWDLTHGNMGLIRYDETTGRWIPSLMDGAHFWG